MALEGSLSDFGLADILQLIYFQKKTGVLTLSGNKDKVRIVFSDGKIASAESRRRMEENRLGKILLTKGLIKEEDLKAALSEQKATGVKIGDIFVNKGLVDKEEIKATLIFQITETVVQLFSWKEGTYEFQSQPIAVNRDMPIALDTQHLLMEGLRIIDEWSLIEGKITLDTIFKRRGAGETPLSTDEERLLACVDGENDVSSIIDLSGMGDFETSKALVSLMERGVIGPVEVSPVIQEIVVPTAAKKERSLGKLLPPALIIVALVLSLAIPLLREDESSIGAFLRGDALKKLKAVREIDFLRLKAEVYKHGTGSYPVDLDRLGAAEDVWGRPYVYRIKQHGVAIISAGPDGKIGTADDVY